MFPDIEIFFFILLPIIGHFAISLPVIKNRHEGLIIVGSIPIGKGVNRKQHISMFASDSSSGWSAKNDSSFQLVSMTMSRFTNQ